MNFYKKKNIDTTVFILPLSFFHIYIYIIHTSNLRFQIAIFDQRGSNEGARGRSERERGASRNHRGSTGGAPGRSIREPELLL